MELLLGHLARAEVLRRHHAAGGQNAQQLIEVRVPRSLRGVQRVCERLGGRNIDANADCQSGFFQRQKLLPVGWAVPAQNGQRWIVAKDLLGDGNVGQQHELFHQCICFFQIVQTDI